MARTLKVNIIGDASSLNRALGSATKQSSGAGRAFAGLGKAAALAGAALGAAAAVGIKKSIDAASNLTEQINKANVVFRGNEKQVLEWSKGLETSFGLSQRAALEAAGTFGNMLVPMGFARKEAAAMSEQMVELSGDMASFNNASPEDTLLAIRAGLAGEAEPLRKFGVFLSEARIQQEALTETGKDNVKQLTAQEKATARYNLILKDTKDTQGDFARSAGDSMANQMRILRASFEDVAASLGTIFLPIVIKVFGFINRFVVPALQDAADWTAKFFAAFSNAKGVPAKLSVVGQAFKDLGKTIVTSIDHALFGFDKLMALPGGGATLISVQGLDDKFAQAFANLNWDRVGNQIIDGIIAAIQGSGRLAKALADTLLAGARQIKWEEVGKVMGPGLATAIVVAFTTLTDVSFWARNWELALAVGLVAFGGVFGKFAGKAALAIFGPLRALGSSIVSGLATALNEALPRLGPVIIGGIALALRAVIAVLGALWSKLDDAFVKVASKLGPLLTNVLKVAFIATAITAIANLLTALVTGFVRVTNAVSEKGRAIGKAIVDAIKSALDALPGMLSSQFAKIPFAIISAAATVGVWAMSLGAAIVSGIIRGMAGLVTSVASSIIGGVKSAIGSAMGVFGHSPQEVIGVALVDGILRGWNVASAKMAPALVDKTNTAIDKIIAAVRNRQGEFASAFDGLVSNALAAFDKLTSEFETRTERIIRKQDEAKAEADRQGALTSAMNQLSAATTPEEIDAANQAIADATEAIQRASLERQAAAERVAYEEKRERQRSNIEEQLGKLEKSYATQEISTQQFHTRLLGIFKKFEIPLGNATKKLGFALAKGLNESFDDVERAAKALAQVVLDAFKDLKIVIRASVEGTNPDGKRALGGPVRRGGAYIVGELGPELFVPTSNGTIHTAESTAKMATAGGGVTVIINGDVTGDEIVQRVREGLLRVDLYNPGSAIARA